MPMCPKCGINNLIVCPCCNGMFCMCGYMKKGHQGFHDVNQFYPENEE